MNQFQSPQEAIDAFNKAFEEEWKHFASVFKLDETKDPKTYKATRMVFHAGYSAGAKWVSGVVVERMIGKAPDTASKA